MTNLSGGVAGLTALLAAAPAWAAHWQVDAAHSRLGFAGVQLGTPFQGGFGGFQASIDFDPADPRSAHVVVTVDLASAHTGDAQRDGAMPGAEWFDTAKSREARFEATGFVAKGGDAYEALGTLSLRGAAKTCTLVFTLTTTGDTAHAIGHADVLRTDFGVGQGPWSTDEYVALQVSVTFDLAARRG